MLESLGAMMHLRWGACTDEAAAVVAEAIALFVACFLRLITHPTHTCYCHSTTHTQHTADALCRRANRNNMSLPAVLCLIRHPLLFPQVGDSLCCPISMQKEQQLGVVRVCCSVCDIKCNTQQHTHAAVVCRRANTTVSLPAVLRLIRHPPLYDGSGKTHCVDISSAAAAGPVVLCLFCPWTAAVHKYVQTCFASL